MKFLMTYAQDPAHRPTPETIAKIERYTKEMIERGDQRVVRELLGQRHVAQDAHEIADHPRALLLPHRGDGVSRRIDGHRRRL